MLLKAASAKWICCHHLFSTHTYFLQTCSSKTLLWKKEKHFKSKLSKYHIMPDKHDPLAGLNKLNVEKDKRMHEFH